MNLTPEELESASVPIVDGTLSLARLAAAEHVLRLLNDSGGVVQAGADAVQIAEVLTLRDPADPQYRLLSMFEQEWALMVVQLVEHATRPGPQSPDAHAVNDARSRGVTWQAIAETLGITTQSAHTRYKPGRPRGGRRGPRKQT